MSENPKSTPVGEFEAIYRANADPWAYTWKGAIKAALATRFYERRKYWRTLKAIPAGRHPQALEIGCSIGVFTRMMASRCDELTAIDYSPTAVAIAQGRCSGLPNVRIREAKVPEQFPAGQFDLIVFSEVAYYLSRADFLATAERIAAQLAPGGHLVMVHYRHHSDFPLDAEFAHDWFVNGGAPGIRHLADRRRPAYRLDLFQRAA